MQRRYEHINLPIEAVRTLVAIAETGGFSKASIKLGLSQPAISAQMKRLQMLVGGAIFDKTGGRVSFTHKGELVVAQARKLLQANDQILSFGGATNSPQSLRVGVATALGEHFLSFLEFNQDDGFAQFVCQHSFELAKSYENGHLDIVCLINPPEELGEPTLEWQEDFVWVRSRDFVLRPGSAIPVVGWPNTLADGPMFTALKNKGLLYRLVFSSFDYHIRIKAVAAGIGVMGLPERGLEEPLVVAKEYYLPPLKPARAAVFVRTEDQTGSVSKVIETFKRLALPASAAAGRRIA